jgi:TorA maturation chaperone TorD
MTFRTVLLSGLVAGVFASAVPVVAAPQPVRSSQSRFDRAAVDRAFRSVLNRKPRPYELRRYVSLMDEYGWTEQDVRRDLGGRSDYRRYSADSSLDLDSIITRAFEDILGREPDQATMRTHRRRMTQEGWSERDVREDLRQRPEYRSSNNRNSSADRIITRAYQDILNREPDPSGLSAYRKAIINDGWDEQDVRQMLQNSDERRGIQSGDERGGRQGRGTATRNDDERGGRQGRGTAARGQDDVNQVVRNAYLAVLHREPDANGLRDYGQRVERDNWTQADVEKALRGSSEYRARGR